MMKRTTGERVFSICNVIVLALLALACVVPVWHVLCASVSDPYEVAISRDFIFYPLKTFQTEAYKIILTYKGLWTGYLNTIFYVVCQCILAVVFSCIGGYILSRKTLRYKGLFALIMLIPMMFNGGMVPTFLVMQKLKLLDTRLVMILPGAINIIYFIFMKIAIESVPDSLEESAYLDGAGAFRTMVQVILPLCKATLAVIVLFTAIAKWNDYMSALIYLPTKTEYYPLQMYIRSILNNSQNITNASQAIDNANMYAQQVEYAVIIVTIAPILCIYPFVQKYFVKGVTLGAVKG